MGRASRAMSVTAAAIAALLLPLLLAGCAPAEQPAPSTPASGGPQTTPGATSSAGGPQTLGAPETIATGLESPWSVIPVPGGGALVSQRDDAKIVEIDADGAKRIVGVVPGTVPAGEAGLNGIALWTGDGGTWLYAYHATADGNEVVRLPFEGEPGAYRLGAAQSVLRGIRSSSNHNGGRLAFGPDGMLYVTTGDAGRPDDAQDRASLNGKILRITPEGEHAPGNPFGTAVYSYGHRNVQGLAWSADGTMWATEFGQNTWDELNVIVPGGNYGWPVVEGRADDSRFRDPVRQWPTDQASPSGLAAVGDTLYLACLRGERLWQVRTEGARAVGDPVALLTDRGRLRDAVTDASGALWVLTDNTDGRGSPRTGDDRLLRFAVTGAPAH